MMKYFFSQSNVLGLLPHLQIKLRDFKQISQTKPIKLKDEEIQYLFNLQNINPLWKIGEKQISREIKFKNFTEAFSFMNQVAILADYMDHHPDWENVYNQVKVNLNTHDVGGVSIKDVVLAFAIDKIAFNINLKSAESISDTKLLELHGIAQSWNDNYSKSV
ncbi:hypothetical protein pb186bvf_018630 [Paramecium bursaria]